MLMYRKIDVIEDDVQRIKLNVALHHIFESGTAKRREELTFKIKDNWHMVDCLDFYKAREIIRDDEIDLTHMIVVPGLKGVFPAYLNPETKSFITYIDEWSLLGISEYRGFFARSGMRALTHPSLASETEKKVYLKDGTLTTQKTEKGEFKMWIEGDNL